MNIHSFLGKIKIGFGPICIRWQFIPLVSGCMPRPCRPTYLTLSVAVGQILGWYLNKNIGVRFRLQDWMPLTEVLPCKHHEAGMQVLDTYPLPGHGPGKWAPIWQGMPVAPPISWFQFLKLACKCHGPAMHLHLHWDLNAFQGLTWSVFYFLSILSCWTCWCFQTLRQHFYS